MVNLNYDALYIFEEIDSLYEVILEMEEISDEYKNEILKSLHIIESRVKAYAKKYNAETR